MQVLAGSPNYPSSSILMQRVLPARVGDDGRIYANKTLSGHFVHTSNYEEQLTK